MRWEIFSPPICCVSSKEKEIVRAINITIFGTDILYSQFRTLHGYEVMNMIRKGQLHGMSKGDTLSQVMFIASLFGVAS